MTQDDVIRLAREAGLDIGVWEKLYDDDDVFGYEVGGINENLEAFAKLVAKHEREACAKACAELGEWACVHAIETRGEQA